LFSAYLMVLVGGGAGSLLRYLVGSAVMNRMGGHFPYGTLIVNVSGCFVVGLAMTVLTEKLHLHPNWRLLLVVGFLGGYTTFSALGWETYSALQNGGRWIGLLNVAATAVCGYLAVWLGAAIARQ
jgi:fluoride exporter